MKNYRHTGKEWSFISGSRQVVNDVKKSEGNEQNLNPNPKPDLIVPIKNSDNLIEVEPEVEDYVKSIGRGS